ncbi:MAG: heparan-alpha-glucosaminide N-acetyltransferase domain-containing protein [Chitinophagaceae bacterium]
MRPTLRQNKKRIESIDLLRGIVIIIMALDHVRDYFHAGNFLYEPNDMSQTNGAVFFTRWITHFCAPVFVFLAGTSAFLVGERKTKKELSAFLLKRGIWLMLLEVVVITFAWTFNPAYIIFRLQVIWVLGLAMIIMSALIYLPPKIILIIGLVILFGHNLLDNIHATGNSFKDFLWAELHERKRFFLAGHQVTTGYSILAWLGIMMLGYSFGIFYKKGIDPALRKKYLLGIGSTAISLFLLLRGINSYGDMAPWSTQSSFELTICSFLNVTKYPPSLMYTLMTLGPALIALAFLEKPLNWVGKTIIPIGRVPLFFYILHIFLIHGLAVIAVVVSGRPWTDMIITTIANAKESPWLQGYGFSLAGTYVVWMLVILLLYPLCRWYDKYKTSHKEKWWLSYL